MNIERLIVGPLETNTYIVTKNNKTVIIDPGFEEEKIIKACENKNVVGILITHHHFDHVTALPKIEEYFHLKESRKIKDFSFEVIPTPGHTSDSVSFYFKEDKVLFSGDFIFLDSIGRCDLPTGNYEEMQESLKLISQYPSDITIYPGHGEATTLKHEKQNFKYYGVEI